MPPWLLLGVAAPAAATPDLSALATREVDRQFCRSSDPKEILVCGSRGARDRYRTADPNAPFDVHGNVMSVALERSRWIEGGEKGPGTCSPVGPGGGSLCMAKRFKRDWLQNPRHR